MKRTLLAFPLLAALALPLRAGDPPVVVDVYKSATCGCCGGWEAHLRAAGFTVRSHVVDDVSATRDELGMPSAYASCHTARVGKYLVEGHVPPPTCAACWLNIRKTPSGWPRPACRPVPPA